MGEGVSGEDITDDHAHLQPDGLLTIRKGFPWDGNSGPCIDCRSSLEASCVHDVLCDWVNTDRLPDCLQPIIDQEYYDLCVVRKMWWRRARMRMLAIRWYMAGKGAKRCYIREIKEA